MIDTIKIYAEIDKEIYTKISHKSIVKSSVNRKDGELLYEIINDSLEGSYSSKLSVHPCVGSKYRFSEKGYCLEIEGSYHKILKGYNSHDGIYNLLYILKGMIDKVEKAYNVKLPDYDKWYLYRVDIAKCFDLVNQKNVINYINSLSYCKYPRRKSQFYANEALYFAGTTTTFKIYNKALEFKKHDQKKFKDTDFDLIKYFDRIDGYVRFEVEIKKKTLLKFSKNTFGHLKVIDVEYRDLEKVWSDEVMRFLGIIENDYKIVRGKEEVKQRLLSLYKNAKAMRLFNFYCAIQLNGIDFVKNDTSSTVYYRNIQELKEARVDYSQIYKIEEISNFYFNPFECEEVV